MTEDVDLASSERRGLTAGPRTNVFGTMGERGLATNLLTKAIQGRR